MQKVRIRYTYREKEPDGEYSSTANEITTIELPLKKNQVITEIELYDDDENEH